jgi:hypothetical protein
MLVCLLTCSACIPTPPPATEVIYKDVIVYVGPDPLYFQPTFAPTFTGNSCRNYIEYGLELELALGSCNLDKAMIQEWADKHLTPIQYNNPMKEE